MQTTATTNKSNERIIKLKKCILFGIIVVLLIVGWHCYDYFLNKEKASTDEESAGRNDILKLSGQLYDLELKKNPYLLRVNFQGRTNSHEKTDKAVEPLLQLQHDALLADTTSTTYLLQRLYDNYELDTHITEQVTPAEQAEELDFLQAILNTAIMKRTMQFLVEKGLVAGNAAAQLQLLQRIWFLQYSRGHGRVGSSGFEHVFLAEIKEHSILGLHNWLYFSAQEQSGNLDYKGYMDRIDFDKTNQDQHLLAVRFTFHSIPKPYNTLFIGTSPELEMSLYTVCFLLSAGEACPVRLGHVRFNIVTHAWDWHGKKTLATAYASID